MAISSSPLSERLAMIASWQRIWQSFAVTFHAVTNHQVELRGDRATRRAYVQALHVAHDGRELVTFGFYTDQLVRQPDRGRITARQYTEIHRQGDPTVFPRI